MAHQVHITTPKAFGACACCMEMRCKMSPLRVPHLHIVSPLSETLHTYTAHPLAVCHTIQQTNVCTNTCLVVSRKPCYPCTGGHVVWAGPKCMLNGCQQLAGSCGPDNAHIVLSTCPINAQAVH